MASNAASCPAQTSSTRASSGSLRRKRPGSAPGSGTLTSTATGPVSPSGGRLRGIPYGRSCARRGAEVLGRGARPRTRAAPALEVGARGAEHPCLPLTVDPRPTKRERVHAHLSCGLGQLAFGQRPRALRARGPLLPQRRKPSAVDGTWPLIHTRRGGGRKVGRSVKE